MKKLLVGRSPTLAIRGVLADEDIHKDEIIEVSPVLIIPRHQIDAVKQTTIANYYYEWDDEFALAFGLGSLFNHSYHANAEYDQDNENLTLIFVAVKDIRRGEEVFINYNGPCDDATRVEMLERQK
jgi:SET domain-containing protein